MFSLYSVINFPGALGRVLQKKFDLRGVEKFVVNLVIELVGGISYHPLWGKLIFSAIFNSLNVVYLHLLAWNPPHTHVLQAYHGDTFHNSRERGLCVLHIARCMSLVNI